MRKNHMVWRVPLAIGVVFLLALTILAVGSRAGMGLGILALLLTPFLVREKLSRTLFADYTLGPRTILIIILALLALLALLASLVVLSVIFGRALSIERMGAFDLTGDMRTFGLPTVLGIARNYFPIGIGPGAFDAAFRIYEPTDILSPLYFNHAHNDLLEVILESGIFGLSLMLIAIGWWAIASARVWRRAKANTGSHLTGRLGSATILLVLLASAVDYPARTPMIMAVIVIAACWLAWGARAARDTATLPENARSL
jgi:O-antigen ligase